MPLLECLGASAPAMEASMLGTFDQAAPAQAGAPKWADVLRTLNRGGSGMMRRWIDRSNQRHALADLDDRLLRDIGVSGGAAFREASKPFWR